MYSITQFAKMISVTPKTLRIWDKENKFVLKRSYKKKVEKAENNLKEIKNEIT
jgi:phage antirepressor YoqD-like protein